MDLRRLAAGAAQRAGCGWSGRVRVLDLVRALGPGTLARRVLAPLVPPDSGQVSRIWV